MNEHYARAPHRASASTSRHSAALLIDFDNVTMGVRSNLGQELRNFLDSDIIRGKVAVQRAYADWRRYPQYIVPLSEASVDLIFAPAYGSSKKNATDIRLAIDALELVFTRPEIETFILLSGDSDFSSLVLKLKEYGKYVIGVGLQESTSDILVQNCDEYYSYDRVSGLTSADDLPTEKHDPWELTMRAVARMVERGDVMRSDRLKQVMLEMDPGFDERTAGYSKFNRFLGEAARRGGVVLNKRENGQYEVAPAANGGSGGDAGGGREAKGAKVADDSSRRRSRRGRRGRSGRGRAPDSKPAAKTSPAPSSAPSDAPATSGKRGKDGVEAAYEALVRAVGDLSPGGEPVRDSMAKRKLLEYDASFDERTYGFSKFGLFLRAAHEAGVIRMTRQEDGNHYLTLVREGEGRERRKAAPEATARQASAGQPSTGGRGRSPFSAAAAAARKTFGRLRRGQDAGEEEGPSTAESAPAAESAAKAPVRDKPRSDAKRAPRPEGGRPSKPEARRAPKSGAERGPKPEARRAPTSDARPGPKAGGGREAGPRRPKPQAERKPEAERKPRAEREPRAGADGRSRAQSSPPPREKAPRGTQPETGKEAEASPPAAAPRRTLGRYRSGSRGRTAPTQSAATTGTPRIGPISDDELSSDTAPAKGAGPPKKSAEPPPAKPRRDARASAAAATPAAGPVGHMVRTYAGVGKRTAEVLVEHFGEQVFDVIDADPGRLTEVLSEGRANIVRKARRAELES